MILVRVDPCDPTDLDVIEVDLSVNLPDGVGIVGTPSFTVSPSTMLLPGWAAAGTDALVWFQNGASGTDYTISCHFSTTDGRRRTRSFKMYCGPR